MAGVIKLGLGDSITVVNDGLVDPGYGKPGLPKPPGGGTTPPGPEDPGWGWNTPHPDHGLPTDPHPDHDLPIWILPGPGEPPEERRFKKVIVWVPPTEEGAVGIFQVALVPAGDTPIAQPQKRR